MTISTPNADPYDSPSACRGAPIIGPGPAQRVAELGWSMWASAAVQAGIQLRLADAVDEEPTPAHVVARRAGTHPQATDRLLRTLASLGIFQQVEPGCYSHTDESRMLRSDAPEALSDIMLTGSHWGWAIWGRLGESVRTGQSAVVDVFGKDLFTYFLEDDPEAGELCLKGYAAQSRVMNQGTVRALDLTGARTFCDVGGGHGSLTSAVLEAHDDLHGILFDREQTIQEALPELRESPLAQRCTTVAGDCFNEVPPADIYLIRQVLHMWEDDACIQVLDNCRRAGGPGARIVILEQLIEDPPETPWDGLMDLHMLLVMGGRERSSGEYADLLRRAGIDHVATTSTNTPLRLVEGRVPADS